jgi:acylphosphatase
VQRIHLIVLGVVQGVGFRRFALREAKRFDLTGWVRNLPDGNVEIEAQGETDNLERFVGWANRGAPTGRVDRVEKKILSVVADEEGFAIIG